MARSEQSGGVDDRDDHEKNDTRRRQCIIILLHLPDIISIVIREKKDTIQIKQFSMRKKFKRNHTRRSYNIIVICKWCNYFYDLNTITYQDRRRNSRRSVGTTIAMRIRGRWCVRARDVFVRECACSPTVRARGAGWGARRVADSHWPRATPSRALSFLLHTSARALDLFFTSFFFSVLLLL